MKCYTTARCSHCFIVGKKMEKGSLICQGCVATRTPCTPPRIGNPQEYREKMLDILRSADDLPRTDMQRQQASLLVHVCVSRMNNSVDTDTSLNICDGPLLDIIKKLTQNLADLSQFTESNMFPFLQLGELYHDNLFCCIIERVGLGFYEDIAEFTKLVLLELHKPFGSPRGNTLAPQVSQSLESSQGCPPENVEQVALLASGMEDMYNENLNENLAEINSPITSALRDFPKNLPAALREVPESDDARLEALRDFPKSDDVRQWVSLLNSLVYPRQTNPHETESVDTWKVYLGTLEQQVAEEAFQVIEARAEARLVENEMAAGTFITNDHFDGKTSNADLDSALREFSDDLILRRPT